MSEKITIPKALQDGLKTRTVIPFVGSGVSLAVRDKLFPTWPELLNLLVDKLVEQAEENSSTIVSGFIKENMLYEAAGVAYDRLGKSLFNDVMREHFNIDAPGDVDLSIPEAIWRLRPSLVITTNYDSVLKWANPKTQLVLNDQTSNLAKIGEDEKRPSLWHLHGHSSDPDTLILAPSQYEQLYDPHRTDSYKAAREKLRSQVSSNRLLFIGFGMDDQYVMGMLKDVLAVFDSNLPPNYALLKAGDDHHLWNEFNIKVIEFDDFGEPLSALLVELSSSLETPSEGPKKTTPATDKTQNTSVTDTTLFPGCTVEMKPAPAKSITDFISVLENRFSFEWVPGQYEAGKDTIVYWPVRLRRPGAIHAVQTFAAAGLQRQGAKVILCLDDFGDQRYDAHEFEAKVKHWLKRADGKPDALEVTLFRALIDPGNGAFAWKHVQAWLGNKNYDLGQVLEICKLYKVDMQSQDFVHRGTGRLLTPGLVWACLWQVLSNHSDHSFITLGGYDERNLWAAWRACAPKENPKVGHLYIPELADVHMQETGLVWESQTTIEKSIVKRLTAEQGKTDWRSPNGIINWSLHGCVLLPQYLTSTNKTVSVVKEMTAQDPEAIIKPLSQAIAKWIP